MVNDFNVVAKRTITSRGRQLAFHDGDVDSPPPGPGNAAEPGSVGDGRAATAGNQSRPAEGRAEAAFSSHPKGGLWLKVQLLPPPLSSSFLLMVAL